MLLLLSPLYLLTLLHPPTGLLHRGIHPPPGTGKSIPPRSTGHLEVIDEASEQAMHACTSGQSGPPRELHRGPRSRFTWVRRPKRVLEPRLMGANGSPIVVDAPNTKTLA